MEMENKFGKMDPYMKAIGKMIWRMAKEDSFIPAGMFMKVIGSMTKPKEKECIYISMVLAIQENGIKINSMVLAKKNGSMGLNIREIFLMA